MNISSSFIFILAIQLPWRATRGQSAPACTALYRPRTKHTPPDGCTRKREHARGRRGLRGGKPPTKLASLFATSLYASASSGAPFSASVFSHGFARTTAREFANLCSLHFGGSHASEAATRHWQSSQLVSAYAVELASRDAGVWAHPRAS